MKLVQLTKRTLNKLCLCTVLNTYEQLSTDLKEHIIATGSEVILDFTLILSAATT